MQVWMSVLLALRGPYMVHLSKRILQTKILGKEAASEFYPFYIYTYMYYMRISMVTMSLEQRRCLFIRLSRQQVDNNALLVRHMRADQHAKDAGSKQVAN